MLPERLCNFICSLRPDEEKLTFSAVFDMDENANVKSSRIVHTVIKSDRRFAYEEVQEILEKNGEARDVEGAVPVEPEKRQGEFCNELITLNRFAHILRDKRMKEGAIDFDREEVRFDIDEQGKPTGVYFKRSKDANKLIEEFMLLANRTVAESVGKVKKGEKAKTLPYRIHDTPDPAKLENLGTFVTRFGLKLNTYGTKEDVAKNLNTLLREVRGKKMQEIVEDVSLRAMMKAKYSTYNIGHYGLAFDYYTHFTSPIRRYPDLMVHRLLTKYAEGAKSAEQKKYEEFCEHCSEMEQLAANAERSSIKYKQVEFLSDKIGQEFDATVSSVTEFGVYAEIDQYKCEGLIPVRSLGNEAFDFDDRNFALVGRKTHKVFTLGDKLKIKIVRTDLYRKQVDFDLVDKEENSSDTTAPKPFYMGLAADKQTAKSSKKTKKAKKTKVKTRSRKKK
jgi:ribonuclease R